MSKKKLTKFEKWFAALRCVVRVFLQPVYRFRKHGHMSTYDDRAYIFISNHLSLIDVAGFVKATNNPVHFLAKRDLFERGIMRWFVLKSQCIPVNRDGNDVKAVMQSLKYLKSGESLGIFPEGTRNTSGEVLLPFKSGAAAIAIKTKTPVVPIVQLRKPRPFKRTHFIVGEPIELTEYYDKRLSEEDIAFCDNMLRERMLMLRDELSDIVAKKKK